MAEANQNGIGDRTFVERFSLQWRIQHAVLLVSVLILVCTGIPLWCMKEPGLVWWSESTVRNSGFVEVVRVIHRTGAVGLIAVSIYHVLHTITTREGRREFLELLPRPKDFTDVTQNSLYFLGIRARPPRFGRYTYYEKFDYWAVYWGCVIMIGSGLALWFPGLSAKIAPWFAYGLAVIIHKDEAVLATLAIFIWHFYNVHLNPSRFPGTLLWWHGKISREEMLEHHPLEYEKLTGEANSHDAE